MSAPHRIDYPAFWKAQAKELDARGHFANYSAKQYKEVLRKGYLGSYDPEAALGLAISKLEAGLARPSPKLIDELRDHFGVVGAEARREFLLDRTREAQPDDYEPPFEILASPAYPYIYESPSLARSVYLKFRVLVDGKKPHIVFISCHRPKQQRKVK